MHTSPPAIRIASTPAFCRLGIGAGQSNRAGRDNIIKSVAEFIAALVYQNFSKSMHVPSGLVTSQNFLIGWQAKRK
jgi:hypothetical protein